jgi:hypothetical protein
MPEETFQSRTRSYPRSLLAPAVSLWCVASLLPAVVPTDVLPAEGEPAPAETAAHWRKPPAHSRWEITFQSEASATGSGPAFDTQYRPHRVTVTRHGKDMLQEVLMEDGKCWETWSLGPVQIQSIGGKDAVWLRPPHPKPGGASDPTDHHSFGEFHWIRKEHFRGSFPVLGVRAAVYLFPLADTASQTLDRLRAAPKGPLAGLPLCEGILAAAIHPETKYPLVLQKGAQLRMYSIAPLPQGALLLPDKIIRFRQLLSAPARVAPKPLP